MQSKNIKITKTVADSLCDRLEKQFGEIVVDRLTNEKLYEILISVINFSYNKGYSAGIGSHSKSIKRNKK